METFSALLAICAGNTPVTGHRTKASDAELWCFLWSAPETVEYTMLRLMIWDAIVPIMTSLSCDFLLPGKCPDRFWKLNNTSLLGGILVPGLNTPDGCKGWCLNNSTCVAVDFNKEVRQCFFHTTLTGTLQSGTRPCCHHFIKINCKLKETSDPFHWHGLTLIPT